MVIWKIRGGACLTSPLLNHKKGAFLYPLPCHRSTKSFNPLGGRNMSELHVALLGFGTVGQGVYEALDTHRERIKDITGKEVRIRAILIKDPSKEREIDPSIKVTTDFDEILEEEGIDVLFEAIVGEEPGYTYLTKAIERGIHVVTANKAMFASKGEDLLTRASEREVAVGFEATTAGGLPIIGAIRQLLNVNEITHIQGILNGTSNFILSQMRKEGLSFERALSIAQEKGYAEADPTSDVGGQDAFYKLMILSRAAFHGQPDWEAVPKKGITDLTSDWLQAAESFSLRFKHVGSIQRDRESISGVVEPVLVKESHPFYGVEDVENVVSVKGSLVGRVTLSGPGAGKLPTGSAMVEDFLSLIEGRYASSETRARIGVESLSRRDGEWVVRTPDETLPEWVDRFDLLDRITLSGHLYLFIRGNEEEWNAVQQADVRLQPYPVLKELPLESRLKREASVR